MAAARSGFSRIPKAARSELEPHRTVTFGETARSALVATCARLRSLAIYRIFMRLDEGEGTTRSFYRPDTRIAATACRGAQTRCAGPRGDEGSAKRERMSNVTDIRDRRTLFRCKLTLRSAMTTRREFIRGAAASGLVFCTCGLIDAAYAQGSHKHPNLGGKRKPVIINGKRVTTID